MSFKSSFESHPVVFGFSLIIVGFGVGFGFRGYLPGLVTSAAPVAAVAATISTCNLPGSEELARAHSDRIQKLRASLEFYEQQSSRFSNTKNEQENYKESASRVRQDILQETEIFKTSVSALSRICAE